MLTLAALQMLEFLLVYVYLVHTVYATVVFMLKA